MKSEEEAQPLLLSKHDKQPDQLTLVDTDELDGSKQKGLNLGPIWRTIRRNVLLIAGVTSMVAAAALYLDTRSLDSYEGSFRLLVEPVTSDAQLTDPSALSRDGAVETTTDNIDYPTLLEVLRSPGLLSGIAKQIQARYPDVSYDSLSQNLVVERFGPDSGNATKPVIDVTRLIEVRYSGEDPKKVQFILEELAKGYLKYSLEDRKARIGGGVQFIEEQLPGLQQRVNQLEGNLQALQQRYELSDPESEGTRLADQARETEAQRLETQRELREQQTLYTNLQRQLKLAPDEAIAASTLSEEPRYQELLGQLKKVESQIAVESTRYSEANPVIQTLRDQQKNLAQLLNQQARSILGQDLPNATGNPKILAFQNPTRMALIKQLADTANQRQVLEVRQQAVTRTEAFLDQKVRQFPAIIRQYHDLQRRLEIATNTLNQLLTQRETLRVEAAQKQVPWKVDSAPEVPHDAAGPIPAPRDTAKKLAMGVIAGLLLGLGAAILREKYRNVFYTTEDLQDTIKLPLLGVIPSKKQAKQLSKVSERAELIEETEANYADVSPFLEAFDALYASIHFLAVEPPVRSLVVSSATPGDGKTTIALHLAQAAAAMGQRVLLVDANLRQPQLHTWLGLPNLQGLSNLLSQDLSPNELIQRSPLGSNLSVLTSGQRLPNSTRLLASPQMQYLMEQFQTAFDLVIYDTPHLLDFADTNFLAEYTDGILMVVGVGKTDRSIVTRVQNRLNTFRLPILGIVANHVEASKDRSSNDDQPHYEQNHWAHSALEEKPKMLEKLH